MFGRFPIRDWFLLLICGWIIAHANWPTGSPVRTVTYHHADGNSRQYIVNADDPQVAIIQNRIKRWDKQATSIALVIARWRRELAEFYCQSPKSPSTRLTASGASQTVTQASFESDRARPQLSDLEYWTIVRDKTDSWISEKEASIAANRELRGEAPVQLGPIQSGRVGISGKLYSILIGAMLASGISLWTLTNPAIQLDVEGDDVRRSSRQTTMDHLNAPIKVEIPARWVRLNQPASVKLRRFVFAAIVLLATTTQLQEILR